MFRSRYPSTFKSLYCATGPLLLGFVVLASGCQRKQPADEHIAVVMKKYAIEPAIIRVKAGERVELSITTTDVQHGLDIPALGIKAPVQPGRTAHVYFTAPGKGEYPMACGVICGPHHDDMVGKLIVE
jgi:heme/copper-type cytochrome/quinol oxidase subunit 2